MIKKAPARKAKATKKPAPKKTAVTRKAVAPKKSAAKTKTVKTKIKAAPKVKKEPKGIPELLRDAALKVLDERQAENIVPVDLRGRSPLTDYMIIASGRSPRQLAAIADHMCQAFAKIGARRVRVEGLPQGDWVLIDAGDILIHLFRPEVRSFYHIEDIWAGGKKR